MLSIGEFFKEFEESLSLEIIAGEGNLDEILEYEGIVRPGLALTGFLEDYSIHRTVVFGKVEHEYLKSMDDETRVDRLSKVLPSTVPLIVITRGMTPLKELVDICKKNKIPLFVSQKETLYVLQKITYFLGRAFSPSESVSGTLVEAFGKGVLIQGDSSVGKSETALGLIVRRHRLVADDVVIIKKREGSYLEGEGAKISRHLMEIRGIGIINVAHLYGAVCVSEKANVDVVVKLEAWDDDQYYDRVGLEEKHKEFLGVNVPYYVVPVKPGRDTVLMIETIVLNHRLKKMGVNSAREFNRKLLDTIAKKQEA
ncbi:MAG: HPr kinase/phosphorylase [Chlamydiia bacterium]|nr:HPr kinase/phosphorylase [Chlamydiia bacterium]